MNYRGQDPRTLLNDVRWQLKMKLPKTHDWASIVAYASVPSDFPDQLIKTRREPSLLPVSKRGASSRASYETVPKCADPIGRSPRDFREAFRTQRRRKKRKTGIADDFE